MYLSKMTQKYQATVPQEIRKILGLHQGDLLAFDIVEEKVILKKARPLDLEFTRALENTLSEWDSLEDDRAYRDL